MFRVATINAMLMKIRAVAEICVTPCALYSDRETCGAPMLRAAHPLGGGGESEKLLFTKSIAHNGGCR
jgi:hypothetical protein